MAESENNDLSSVTVFDQLDKDKQEQQQQTIIVKSQDSKESNKYVQFQNESGILIDKHISSDNNLQEQDNNNKEQQQQNTLAGKDKLNQNFQQAITTSAAVIVGNKLNKQIEQVQQKIQQQQITNNDDEEEKKNKENTHPNLQPDISQQQQQNTMSTYLRKQTIKAAYNERKKESYSNFKNWDDSRNYWVNKHKLLCENILVRLERRIKISMDSFQTIINFFHNRMQSEQIYAKSLSTKGGVKLSNAFKDIGPQQTSWYPKLTEALQRTDEYNEDHAKNVSSLAKYLESSIIKSILVVDEEEYNKRVKVMRESLSKQIKNLNISYQLMQTRLQKYNRLYEMEVLGIGKNKVLPKDLYVYEIKHRKKVQELIVIQTMYGQECHKIWNEIQKLELQRLEHIQRSFQQYTTKYMETYGKMPILENSYKLVSELVPQEDIARNFGVGQIVFKEELDWVKNFQALKQDASLDNLKTFLNNFQFKDMEINGHCLIQKVFRAYRDVGTIGTTWKECQLIITVDDFLLFQDEHIQKDLKLPQLKYLLEYVSVVKRKKEQNQCYIMEKKPGLIYTSTNKQLLKFAKVDDLEEFRFYLKRYWPEDNIFQEESDEQSEK